MNTYTGLAKILLGIVTLGLVPAIFPTFVNWTPPPDFEEARRSKQRRTRPKGYYWSDEDSRKLLMKLLADLSWYEILYLFWTTPVVLLYADKVVSLCFTLMFTVWFVAHRQAVDSGQHGMPIIPFTVSSNLDVEPLQGVELALCIFFSSSLLREVIDVLCRMVSNWDKKWAELLRYASTFWNLLDWGEVVVFFVGISYRVACKAHGNGCMSSRRAGADAEEYKPETWNEWSMAYAVCLCIAWFRTLRSCDILP